MVSQNAKRAKAIIADSLSTKNDIIKYLGTDPSKVNVVYLASEDIFKMLDKDDVDIKVLQKYGINFNFILSVGTIEPRKNFKTLILAFDILKKKYKFKNLKLVIAGKTGWKSEETFDSYNKSKYKEDIIFTGEISDYDLVQLYNTASLFVYPSIFEGFGFPVLEAMSCGLPVIASGTSSIPEVLQHPDLLFEPFDEKEICIKMDEILSNDNLSSYIRKQCIINSKKFSWQKTAAETFNVYRNCI
jgi:glycosyltransferase involved in cell wall biosynthesis